MNKHAALLSLVSVVISLLNLYFLSKIPDEIKLSTSLIKQTDRVNLSPATPGESLPEVNLKRFEDIDKRIAMAGTAISIEDFSKVVAEIDEWLFIQDDDVKATKKIEDITNTLRERINTEIDAQLKAAIDAPNGNAAAEKLARVNSLLSLYPSPANEDQKKKLNETTAAILSASKRVDELQRLRYNKWAIEQIQKELLRYREITKVGGFADVKRLLVADKDALLKNCVNHIRVIDPVLLEPSALDIYNHAYGLTKDALGSDETKLIELAKGLSDPKVKRKNLSDF